MKARQQAALQQQPIQLRTLSLSTLEYLSEKKFSFSDIPNEIGLSQLPSLQQELHTLRQRMKCHQSILLLKFGNKKSASASICLLFCNNSGNKIHVSWDSSDSKKEPRAILRVHLSKNGSKLKKINSGKKTTQHNYALN